MECFNEYNSKISSNQKSSATGETNFRSCLSGLEAGRFSSAGKHADGNFPKINKYYTILLPNKRKGSFKNKYHV